MTLPAIIDTDAFKLISDVGHLHTQGTTSPHTIARRLKITVVEARAALESWREIIRSDVDSQEAARAALDDMLHRYDNLLVEANSNLDNLKTLEYDEKIANQINSTLKLIGELEAKRVDLLQKSGMLEAHDLGDELAEREERETMIINILKDLCPDCQKHVAEQLALLTGGVTGTVEGEVVE